MALPLDTTGSLSPTFVSARIVTLAVKPPYAFTLLHMISNHAEETFEHLLYSFGGDRPSQTAHLALSNAQFMVSLLESQHQKGGIPTATLLLLTPKLLCLPPILYIQCQNPIPSYSKALRGLSV